MYRFDSQHIVHNRSQQLETFGSRVCFLQQRRLSVFGNKLALDTFHQRTKGHLSLTQAGGNKLRLTALIGIAAEIFPGALQVIILTHELPLPSNKGNGLNNLNSTTYIPMWYTAQRTLTSQLRISTWTSSLPAQLPMTT